MLELPATLETSFGQGSLGENLIMHLITSDISADGAYFKTNSPLPVGSDVKVQMKLVIPGLNEINGRSAHISVRGKTIRTEPFGMAIQFEPAYHMVSRYEYR